MCWLTLFFQKAPSCMKIGLSSVTPTIKYTVQPLTHYLGSIGMDCVIRELCYKGTLLQRNYRKMTIMSFDFMVIFLNFLCKILW